jgi:hypothetical protein
MFFFLSPLFPCFSRVKCSFFSILKYVSVITLAFLAVMLGVHSGGVDILHSGAIFTRSLSSFTVFMIFMCDFLKGYFVKKGCNFSRNTKERASLSSSPALNVNFCLVLYLLFALRSLSFLRGLRLWLYL